MDRRRFVAASGLSLVGLAAGCVPKPPVETDLPSDTPTDTTEPQDSPGPDDCPPTGEDIEGPYYREGVPVRSDLDLYGETGDPLVLSGVVRDADCVPVANAVVELWQANPAGDYDTDTDEKRYYGQIATDAQGRYSFKSLVPGRYLNAGQYRPAHLHMKVWTGDTERLTTQIYFAGDPYNEVDKWFDAERMVTLDDQGHGTFDVAI
jgi:protocatechuate 3,4-dioxygenase beta subunit